MATTPQPRHTYEDLRRFPDDDLRREIIAGDLIVTPAPGTRHQAVVAELLVALHLHAREHGGRAYPAPVDVYFDDDNVVQPDVVFVAEEHRDRIEDRFIRSAPDIVIEVSSPSERRIELVRKRALYERFQVPEYWYIDLEAERVEVFTLDDRRYGPPNVLMLGDELTSPQLSGFSIALKELIAPTTT